MDYLPRIVDSELDELLGHLPALAIEGAKAIGKTESARRRAGTVHRLDDPNQRQILGADPSRLTNGAAPIGTAA